MKRGALAVFVLSACACLTSHFAAAEGFRGSWPEGADPASVSARISAQFLSTDPRDYRPEGFGGDGKYARKGYGYGTHVQYAVVSLWANAIECARKSGDAELVKRLASRYEPLREAAARATNDWHHVDYCVFGALPCEIYLATGDAGALAVGVEYAERQWARPAANDPQPGYAATALAEREGWWRKGYSPQTRLWIDDVYMICLLQIQAYRATGNGKYLDRAAKEATLYLDRLQLKSGLFHHAPDAPYAWGRGNGWMAAGMALLMEHLPKGDANRAKIERGYRRMMATLLSHQRADGLWGQLVDDGESWAETSGSAMFAYAFQSGVNSGLLDAATYGSAARRAYLALVARLDSRANLADVCEGTNKKNDRAHYLGRGRVNGDPHGQAPMLWLCSAMMDADAGRGPVTYEAFGAKGDGRTDDRRAIVRAHEFANRTGLPVRAADGKTYFIADGPEVAVVRTDVDFGGAKFVIDDSDSTHFKKPMFRVESARRPYPLRGIGALKRSDKAVSSRPYARCVATVVNTNVRQYIRDGRNKNKGDPQQEILLLDENGGIDSVTPLLWDYAEVTASTAYPYDASPLTLSGGVFVTLANRSESKYDYHFKGIEINRSNVRVKGLRHEISGEGDHGAPYGGFVSVDRAADVVVEDCVFTAHRTYETIGSAGVRVPMGSYDLKATRAARLVVRNCRQTTDINDRRYWGLFESDYCKNILFDGCVFSRFDAHKGVFNATVRNCRLGHMGINAIGAGTFLVENTTITCERLFNLRTDYGSTWDGEFVVRNCTYIPTKGRFAYIFWGWNEGKHDFGYPCSMPKKVVFSGLTIDDSRLDAKEGRVYVFDDFRGDGRDRGKPNQYEYAVTKELVLRNVKLASGRKLEISPNEKLFSRLSVRK